MIILVTHKLCIFIDFDDVSSSFDDTKKLTNSKEIQSASDKEVVHFCPDRWGSQL